MPRLSNPKHEAFAQLVANGAPKYKAYRQVFASKKLCNQTGNSSRLWRASESLRNRTHELMAERLKASDLSRDDMLDMMLAQHELASESGQHSAAIKALELVGKEQFRMYTERREVINVNLAHMDRQQLERHIRDRYGDRAQALLDWISASYEPSGDDYSGSAATPAATPAHLQLVYDSDSDA